MRIYRVELLKFSMIHALQLNSSPIFCILGKHELPAPRIEWSGELWQPVSAECNRGAQASRTPFSRGHTMSQTADGLTNYCDDDLTFFALIYKNYDATAQCLGDLRKHYAASRVILRSDGDPDPRFPILAKRNQVDFREELRLFGIENGGDGTEVIKFVCWRCSANNLGVIRRGTGQPGDLILLAEIPDNALDKAITIRNSDKLTGA